MLQYMRHYFSPNSACSRITVLAPKSHSAAQGENKGVFPTLFPWGEENPALEEAVGRVIFQQPGNLGGAPE